MGASKVIDVDGIRIEITKKKMKNMLIKVDRDGQVKISIPNRVSYDQAEAFARKNIDWINKQKRAADKRIESKPLEYITGETVELWGEKYQLEFVPSYSNKGVVVQEEKIILYAPLDSNSQSRKAILFKWYREELAKEIMELKDKCCQIAQVEPYEWHIRDMKTKWGTCNMKARRIWLSLQLVTKPKICLEYVMLHELTHLYVPNHGAEFKAYMDRFCPEWRSIRKMMNG